MTDDSDEESIAFEGANLTDEEAQELEIALSADAGNITARLKLLGYFMMRQFESSEFRDRRREHVLWFIEFAPDHPIAGSPLCGLDCDDLGFRLACSLWAVATEGRIVDPRLLKNAANFFSLPDPERARQLLERGEAKAPGDPHWASELGENLHRDVALARCNEGSPRHRDASAPDRAQLKARAIEALAHFERATRLSQEPEDRLHLLVKCAEAAFDAGRLPQATDHAMAAIALAPKASDDRHLHDSLHVAHTVLGLVAFEQGDLDKACRELDLAGREGSPDSPVLASFGPDFLLANRLLACRRSSEVIAYLKLCERFWKPKHVRVWRKAIEKGERPWMNRFPPPTE